MTLRQVIIKKQNATYKELSALSVLLNTQEIKNNGRIIVKCNLECDLKQIRFEIEGLFSCGFGRIYCMYEE